MELMGPIQALESLTGPHAVTVYSDSKYVVDGITKWIINWRRTGWKQGTVKNRDLWERLARAEAKHHVTWVWVKGHAGIPLNERADELANAAAVKQESYHSSFRETA
jgi:ribonuclease HI